MVRRGPGARGQVGLERSGIGPLTTTSGPRWVPSAVGALGPSVSRTRTAISFSQAGCPHRQQHPEEALANSAGRRSLCRARLAPAGRHRTHGPSGARTRRPSPRGPVPPGSCSHRARAAPSRIGSTWTAACQACRSVSSRARRSRQSSAPCQGVALCMGHRRACACFECSRWSVHRPARALLDRRGSQRGAPGRRGRGTQPLSNPRSPGRPPRRSGAARAPARRSREERIRSRDHTRAPHGRLAEGRPWTESGFGRSRARSFLRPRIHISHGARAWSSPLPFSFRIPACRAFRRPPPDHAHARPRAVGLEPADRSGWLAAGDAELAPDPRSTRPR